MTSNSRIWQEEMLAFQVSGKHAKMFFRQFAAYDPRLIRIRGQRISFYVKGKRKYKFLFDVWIEWAGSSFVVNGLVGRKKVSCNECEFIFNKTNHIWESYMIKFYEKKIGCFNNNQPN